MICLYFCETCLFHSYGHLPGLTSHSEQVDIGTPHRAKTESIQNPVNNTQMSLLHGELIVHKNHTIVNKTGNGSIT